MRPAFRPRLVNNPFSDPVLFIPFAFQKRALLFDLGDLHGLSAKDILKVTHAFVSHTHMDHFIGFDTLLRLFLGRNKTIHLFGPPGFLGQLEGRLSGYTWNLVDRYEHGFSITATEVHQKRIRSRTYHCRKAFKGEAVCEAPFSGAILHEPAFWVEAVCLDHKIPCLGFRLEERFHVNIIKERLVDLNIPIGPWLKAFKTALYQSKDLTERFRVEWQGHEGTERREFTLGDLSSRITRRSKGQKICYVVDTAYTEHNREKIIELAKDADVLYIEAAFSEAEASVAKEKFHLTAAQAGTLAREAGVKRLVPFHFSPRYADTPHRLQREAEEAFAGGSKPEQ
jgi:ribonuclease Z